MPDICYNDFANLAHIRIETDAVRLIAALNPDSNDLIQGEEYGEDWSLGRKNVTEHINQNGFWKSWMDINDTVSGGIYLTDDLTPEAALDFIGYNEHIVITCNEEQAALMLGVLPVGDYVFNIRTTKLVATDIQWDTSNDDDDEVTPEELGLPKEVEIPTGMTDGEEISDYLSNKYGFCHYGFTLSRI